MMTSTQKLTLRLFCETLDELESSPIKRFVLHYDNQSLQELVEHVTREKDARQNFEAFMASLIALHSLEDTISIPSLHRMFQLLPVSPALKSEWEMRYIECHHYIKDAQSGLTTLRQLHQDWVSNLASHPQKSPSDTELTEALLEFREHAFRHVHEGLSYLYNLKHMATQALKELA